MAHVINVLTSFLAQPTPRPNHNTVWPAWPTTYVRAEVISNTAAYLDGWSLVAQCEQNEDEIGALILMLEAQGVKDDFDRGVRDAIDAAFGINVTAS